MAEAVTKLQLFFKLYDELSAEGEDFTMPLGGVPLARFYLCHALFNGQRAREAQEQLLLYLDDVEKAGPQQVLAVASHPSRARIGCTHQLLPAESESRACICGT